MSAFIVEDETINRILAGLEYGDYEHFDGPPKPFGLLKTHSTESQMELGAYLFNMNINGVEHRYGKGQAKGFGPLDYDFKSIMRPKLSQLLKSIHCLLYQCNEGDVPQSNLFKELQQYSDNLAYKIATHTPEYEKAQWG